MECYSEDMNDSSEDGERSPSEQGAMPASAVAELVELFNSHGLEFYVDGGWAVDACLGKQTRPHGDLDIATPHSFVPRIRALLGEHGYVEIPRDDSWECNFVLADEHGHEVDVHSYTLNEDGANIFGVAYKASDLVGTGTIGGIAVSCIPPDVLVQFHTGYPVDEEDYADVKALCDQFSLELPSDYAKFTRPD